MARWLWAPMLLATLVNAWKTAHHKPTRHINIRGWHLELEENKAIRSPNYDECQFYTGRVAREEQSFASVTECGGQLYGLLQVDGREYVIQPDELRERSHVLRRRDVLLAEQTVVYNLTGDTVSDIELEFEEDDDPLPTPHVRPRHSAISDVQHFRNRFMTITRPLAGVKDLWMEMAIVADSTLLKFHGRERVNHYILALMNIVSAIFSDPSLDSNMTLVINKLFLYEEKDSVIKNGNVKKSLEGVNRWNYKHLTKLPTDTTGWDSTIWLTRASLGGPSGYAPVGGVCSRTRSSAIVRDEGLTSAFVIAHELAHLLGLTHDDDKCQLDFQIGYVMAPTVLATLQAYAWSKCSKEQFHEKKGRWWCLHQRSGEEGLELGGAREVKNYVFTMDEQCRTEFGEGFSVCKTVKVRSACSRLWCAQRGIPHVCRSKRGAPLEGTPCGENKWCVDRVCEPMPGPVVTNLTRQFPSWGDWGPCNAECGYGLKKRECLLNGTISKEPCDGATTQLATCWSGVSCGTKDRRGDLCQKHNNRLIPYIQPEESKACEIWCVSYTGGEPVTYGSMPDGAPCSYEMPYDTCYQGTCVKGQCDPSDPDCNWCSEGYCNNNTHYYTRQLSEGWTRITVLPHEARTFSVRLVTPVPLYIALRERRKDTHILELDNHSRRKDDAISKYFKYERNVPQNLQIVDVNSNVIDINEDRRELEGAAVVGGTFVKWRQTDNEIIMTSVSKLLSDLMILAIPENRLMNDEVLTVEVVVNYSTSALRAKPMNYKIEKGPCSVSCGGGLRTVWQRCYSEQHCPPPRFEPCNTHSCVFVWKPGEWEECSATCGDAGVQERQLYCIPANITTSTKRDLIRHSVSPVLCPGSNLTRQQPCNQIPCPVYWQEMAWTPCSTTCGRGTTYRPLSCPAESEVLCGPKPRERRRRCRLRRCPPAARTPRPCPARDATQYCELFTLGQLNRNCLVPSFRKYCCNACRYSDSLKH